nr:uncharacterized protein LOC109171582 [Ipomoea batatas]
MINERSAQIAQRILLRGFETTATAYGGTSSSTPLQDLHGDIETPPQIERNFSFVTHLRSKDPLQICCRRQTRSSAIFRSRLASAGSCGNIASSPASSDTILELCTTVVTRKGKELDSVRKDWRAPGMDDIEKPDDLPDVVVADFKRKRSDVGSTSETLNETAMEFAAVHVTKRKRFLFDNMWLREDKCREIVAQSWDRTIGLDVLSRIECCGQDIWRWGKNYNKDFQRRRTEKNQEQKCSRNTSTHGLKKRTELLSWDHCPGGRSSQAPASLPSANDDRLNLQIWKSSGSKDEIETPQGLINHQLNCQYPYPFSSDEEEVNIKVVQLVADSSDVNALEDVEMQSHDAPTGFEQQE